MIEGEDLASCFGKEAYASPQLAHKALARRKAYKNRGRSMLQVYSCPVCGQFHHGNRKRRRKIKLR